MNQDLLDALRSGIDPLLGQLHEAAIEGDSVRCEALCRQGARPDAFHNEWNAFFYAVDGHHLDALLAMLPFGDATACDRFGIFPLMLGLSRSAPASIVEILLRIGDPTRRDEEGLGLLHWFGMREHSDTPQAQEILDLLARRHPPLLIDHLRHVDGDAHAMLLAALARQEARQIAGESLPSQPAPSRRL